MCVCQSGPSHCCEQEETFQKGSYKMTLHVCGSFWNADSLAVFIRIASGPSIDKLWPFIGSITIETLDQQYDYGHHKTLHWQGRARELSSQKPLEGSENIKRGISRFISYADLERTWSPHFLLLFFYISYLDICTSSKQQKMYIMTESQCLNEYLQEEVYYIWSV